jgi:hypothetical protein
MKINFLLPYTKKFLLIIITIFILFSIGGIPSVKAVEIGRPLEINYPDVPNAINTPTTTKTPIPEYVQYIYYLAIGLGIITALIVFVIAGLQYMTSAGNPSKMQDAKERIISALLGLVILIGSSALLYTINPELVVLEIKDPSASIPSVPTGVILCKSGAGNAVSEAWYLSYTFYFMNPGDAEKEAIRESLIPLVETMNKYCYSHNAGGDIRADFDNQATQVWFVPNWWYNYEEQAWYSSEFGAITYDETGYKKKSTPYVSHLLDPSQPVQPYSFSISGASSLIPFRLIYEPDWSWKITVYNNFNYNDGIAEEDAKEASGSFSGSWWNLFPQAQWGDWFPKSMKTEGDILTVLFTEKNMSESFFSNNVANLEAYDNIIEWEKCENYEGEREKTEETVTGVGFGGAKSYTTKRLCAHGKVNRIFIIAAERM